MCSTPGFHAYTGEPAITFFPLIRAFAFFSFKVLVFSRYLWIFTSNISSHFADRICGDNIGDHKRKLDTNRFVSEFNRPGKIYYWWILQTFIHCLKKDKERRQISTVNDAFLYSLNTDNLGCILASQVRQQTKKALDVWSLNCKLTLKGKRNNNALSRLLIGWAVSRDQLVLMSLNKGIFRTALVIIILVTLRFQKYWSCDVIFCCSRP